MANRKFIILFAALCLFFAFSEKATAQIRDEYVVKAGSEELHFVQRPDLGYVVQAKKEEAAIKSLEETLKQFKTKDIIRVGGRGRKGILVVPAQRSVVENLNTIAALQAQSHIRYAAPLFSAGGETVAIIPEIVVRVIPGTNQDQLETLCQSLSVNIKERLEFTEFEYLIEIPRMDADSVFHAIEQLNQKSIVQWAVPNVAFRPQLLGQVIPNDEYFPNQWHLNNTGQSGGTPGADINAPAAWEITTGNPNIVVAVLDEGVDTDHPDLIDNIVPGYDFVDDDNDPNPTGDDAHGTACAGLIAAKGNNGIGVTGVAWNCKIMPIRIPFGYLEVIETDIATAIRWSANNGADILSNSWGWWSDTYLSLIIHSAIIDVTKQGGIGREGKGCVVLAASGNWLDYGGVVYPAKFPEVIAVGATDHDDVVWGYSGYGPGLDIVAPSGLAGDPPVGNIWTTDIVGSAGYNNRDSNILDYTDKMGGTSAACPIAAGVAALVLSLDPNLINLDVQDILQNSATDLGTTGFDAQYGWGRIDARSALDFMPLFPKRRWIARYNGPGNDWDGSHRSHALAVDNVGNVYVTGSNVDTNMSYDYLTIKYGPNGNKFWDKRYNGPGNNSADYAYALAIDNSYNVYVTGTSDGNGTRRDFATIKYDSNGNQLWVARYNGSANDNDGGNALAVDNSGNVYVTGYSADTFTGQGYTTIKYEPNGNQAWVKYYGENGPEAYALALDNSGNVYVTGGYTTIKYDNNGNKLWSKEIPGIGNDLVTDNSGNVYVAGNCWGVDSEDCLTIKYDSDGNQRWEARYNGTGNSSDWVLAMAIDNSCNVYVTGFSTNDGSVTEYTTIKYNNDGNQLWVAREGGYGFANALAVDNSGNVYVTGPFGDGGDNHQTIEYDPNGNQVWIARYNQGYPVALALDNLGNVYETGCESGGFFTIKYTQRRFCMPFDGDMDGDCEVDFTDFAVLGADWLGNFGFEDLAELVNDWLECNFALAEDCW